MSSGCNGVSIPKGEATNDLGIELLKVLKEKVSIPKGEATNKDRDSFLWVNLEQFQSPKGRLQTLGRDIAKIQELFGFNPQRGGYKLKFHNILCHGLAKFQSPKGRLQTLQQCIHHF